jgi:HEAT repeat protein
MPEHIKGSLDLVTAVVSHPELRVLLEQIRDRESFPSAFDESSAGVTVRGAATVALAFMFPETVEPALLTGLVRGDVGQRSAAARILIEREDKSALITLAALSNDVDLAVRSLVAGGLARWVVKGVVLEESLELVVDMLNEPGVNVGLAVAGALSPDANNSRSISLANLLAVHPSTAVRSHAERMTAGSEPS